VSLGKLIAVYVLQALFWLWLAHEAARDRPRSPSPFAESLWRIDAGATRWFCWSALALSTITFILAVALGSS
jgi:hypothetical protein